MPGKRALKARWLRVSQAAAAAGVSKQTVEYYVMIGLITPLRRPEAMGRYFDTALVRRIRVIHRLNESGYPLREIRKTYLRGRH